MIALLIVQRSTLSATDPGRAGRSVWNRLSLMWHPTQNLPLDVLGPRFLLPLSNELTVVQEEAS